MHWMTLLYETIGDGQVAAATCDRTLPDNYRKNITFFSFWYHVFDWLSMVLRLRQHNIGYTADGFYRSDDPTNSVKALKEGG